MWDLNWNVSIKMQEGWGVGGNEMGGLMEKCDTGDKTGVKTCSKEI